MSIQSIIKGPNKLASRRTVVVNQNLSTLGNGMFTVDLQQFQVDFIPTRMTIRQLLYCNITGADAGIFKLWSSISGQHVAAVYLGIQGCSHMPETIVPIYAYRKDLAFYLDTALAGSFGSGVNGAPTGYLSMTLEFTNSED